MKQLFSQIESELSGPQHQDGWCSLEKANALASAIIALRPGIVVEIGIWSGRSFIPMALALKKVGAGKIIGIDPWRSEESAKEMTGEDLEWWSKVDHEAIMKQFTDWISSTGVGPFAEIHRCRSDQFDGSKIPLIDLLHIDGGHGEIASVHDVDNFARKVRVGGFLYFDDIAWAKKAAGMLPGMGFQRLYIIDGGMMMQRLNYEIA
jgi:predicted O-methyltransferase YrrM